LQWTKSNSRKKKILELYIDKGMRDGEQIKFSGEGDQTPGGVEPGDVVVVLKLTSHPRFEREGANLYYKKEITLFEALCGTTFTVEHLDGRVLRINTGTDSGVIRPGDRKEIPGQGMPMHKNPFEKGYLVVVFDVIFPENRMNDDQKKVLMNVLPQPKPLKEIPKGVHVDEVTLQEYGASERGSRGGQRREVYHGDDGEDEEGGGGVRCAHQ